MVVDGKGDFMKRLALLLSLILFISGCTTNKEKENKKIGCSIESTCDSETEIKKYNSLIETDTFNEISLKDSINIIENKETAILFYGFKTCPWCQDIIPILKEEADNSSVKINYINIRPDGDTSDFDLRKEDNEDYIKLQDFLKDTFIDDSKKVYVPLVITIKNGEILDYNYSTVEGHDAKERELNDEEVIKLKKLLNQMFENYKK